MVRIFVYSVEEVRIFLVRISGDDSFERRFVCIVCRGVFCGKIYGIERIGFYRHGDSLNIHGGRKHVYRRCSYVWRRLDVRILIGVGIRVLGLQDLKIGF